MSLHRPARLLVAAATTSLLGVGLLAAPPATALPLEEPLQAGSPSELTTALAECKSGGVPRTLQLTADVALPSDSAFVECELTLDLNGHDLEIAALYLGSFFEEPFPTGDLVVDDVAGGGRLEVPLGGVSVLSGSTVRFAGGVSEVFSIDASTTTSVAVGGGPRTPVVRAGKVNVGGSLSVTQGILETSAGTELLDGGVGTVEAPGLLVGYVGLGRDGGTLPTSYRYIAFRGDESKDTYFAGADSFDDAVAAYPEGVKPSTKVVFPSDPTPPEGYVFNGWNTEQNGSGMMVTSATDLSEAFPVPAQVGNLNLWPIFSLASASPFTEAPSVTVSGKPIVGGTLSADVTGGDPDASGTTKTYRWFAGGDLVADATAADFTPTSAQRGKTITVEVTSRATVEEVDLEDVTTSEPTDPVLEEFTTKPSVTLDAGPTAPLVGSVVEVSVTGGLPDAEETTRTIEWLVDGELVDDETGTQYVVRLGDVGKPVAARVTSTKTDWVDDVTVSAETAAVALRPFVAGGRTLSVEGRPVVGRPLTAALTSPVTKALGRAPATTVTWQWFADGLAVPGATSPVFRPRVGQYGERLVAQATIRQPGHVTGVVSSRRTAQTELQPLQFTVSTTRVRPGGLVEFTATNLLPGQAWTVSTGGGGRVLATGLTEGQTLTRTVRIPAASVLGKRFLAFTTRGPDRTKRVEITVVR